MTTASVIVPAFNAQDTIEQCLRSLLANGHPDFEVLVIDDGSTDDTPTRLRGFQDRRLTLLENPSRSGPGFSRNHGVQRARGEILLFLDADAYVPPDWIAGHVALHESVDAEIIGGGVVGRAKTIAGKADGFSSWWTSVPYSRDRYVTRLHLPTNNLSIKRSAFERIGGFDEELITGGEDAAFCFKALQVGQRVFFKSDLIAFHHDREGLKAFLAHQAGWAPQALRMRKQRNMEYASLIPSSKTTAALALVPLAAAYAGFIVLKWVRTKPSVLLASPWIFAGKVSQMLAVYRGL